MDKMKISLTGVPLHGNQQFLLKNGGYGKVNWYVADALSKEGYEVNVNDPTADINICCDNPGWLDYKGINPRYKNQYNIGYSTHESTEITSEWVQGFNSVDEVWAMSPWIKECFDKYTNKVKAVVHPGLSDLYAPVQREHKDKFYFLHNGEPTERKMGSLVFKAFVEEFGNNPDVVLVFKTFNGHNIAEANNYENVLFVNGSLQEEKYIGLLGRVHCLVYPTLGEGGGLMPLEAMATGMPVISTWEWADYKDFIHLKLESTLSPIPEEIQRVSFLRGNGTLTTVESIREQMVKVYENYEFYQNLYYNQSTLIASRYSWLQIVSDNAIPRLKELETLL